jgi:hypothetical protein
MFGGITSKQRSSDVHLMRIYGRSSSVTEKKRNAGAGSL